MEISGQNLTDKLDKKKKPCEKVCAVPGCDKTPEDGVGVFSFPSATLETEKCPEWYPSDRHRKGQLQNHPQSSFLCQDHFDVDNIDIPAAVPPSSETNLDTEKPLSFISDGTPSILQLQQQPVSAASCSVKRPKKVAARGKRKKALNEVTNSDYHIEEHAEKIVIKVEPNQELYCDPVNLSSDDNIEEDSSDLSSFIPTEYHIPNSCPSPRQQEKDEATVEKNYRDNEGEMVILPEDIKMERNDIDTDDDPLAHVEIKKSPPEVKAPTRRHRKSLVVAAKKFEPVELIQPMPKNSKPESREPGSWRKMRLIQRNQIISLRNAGVSIRSISQQLGISSSTVSKWSKRQEETGNLSDLERSARPRVTSRTDDEAIRCALEDNPFMNAVAICNRLQLSVSAATIRRRLHDFGIHTRVIAKKERMTDPQRKGRLSFAHRYVDLDEEFWSRVIFTEGKTFIGTTQNRVILRRIDTTKSRQKKIHGEIKCPQFTLNAWGWISMHGMGDVIKIDGEFTVEKYLDILENFFLPSLQNRLPFATGPIIVVQEQCPIFLSEEVSEWFAEKNDLQLLDWPCKSSDLNPIEDVWANIISSWKFDEEDSSENLMAHIHDQWESFRNKAEHMRSHISLMSDRLQAVINSNGKWTRYCSWN